MVRGRESGLASYQTTNEFPQKKRCCAGTKFSNSKSLKRFHSMPSKLGSEAVRFLSYGEADSVPFMMKKI